MQGTKEHYDLLSQFEKQLGKRYRYDKEDKSTWHKQRIYQDGMVNEMFLLFQQGYALGKAYERMNG